MKKCGKCKQTKPLSRFAKNRSRVSGLHNECMQCQLDYNRIWFAQKNYGLSKEIATKLIEHVKSGNAFCGICSEQLELRKSGYAIDHDHRTGRVRELLCTACNKALGGFKEDLYILQKAMTYLERNYGKSHG